MSDWKQMARARGWTMPDEELDRLAAVLTSLEIAFEPLTLEIRHETEPAVILSDAAVAGE
jgi:hypothetical protein